jgi:VWFA-related protein
MMDRRSEAEVDGRKPILHAFVPVLLALASVAAPAAAQEAGALDADGWGELGHFGEEISVEVINLEVWVTDEQGNPVTDLTRDDFEIYEDGEPVEVTNFAVYEGAGSSSGRVSSPAQEIAPETTLEAVDEPAPSEESRLHLAVLVDHRTIRPADRARVFQDLREFLADNLEAGDRVAIATHDRSLQLVQRFSERPADVIRTLERIESIAPRGTQLRSERRSAIQEINHHMRDVAETNPLGEKPCDFAIGYMLGTARRYATSVQGHVQSSAGALATLARTLAGVPGRRAILYVSNGLPQIPGLVLFEYISQLCPDQRSEFAGFQSEYDMSWLYEEVAARANAAGVTIYTVEAQSPAVDLGLDSAFGAESSGGSSGTSGRRFQPATHIQRIESQDLESSLVLMAQQTGGRSFLNAADFSNDFRRLARDLRSYYSLGFRPTDPGDGELHRLEVKLTDGQDYRVRHRLRYRDKPAAERMAERVRGVAQFGTEVNPLHVKIEVGESFPAADGSFRVPARIWVPFEHLTLLESEEGGLRGRLRVLLATTGADGQLQPVRQKVVPLQVAVPEGAERPPGEHLVEVQLTLPPGDHHVALAVRDDVGGETSYLRDRFRVPSPGVEARARGD